MLARTLGLSAALALAANAVLIPSTTALDAEVVEEGISKQLLQDVALVRFECPGCPYARFDEGKNLVWSTNGIENSLVYEFSTGKYHDRLALNGVQLFPPAFEEPEPLYIHQFPSMIDVDDVPEFLNTHPDRRRLRITKMVFAFNSAQTISDHGNELLTMQLTVSGLEGQNITPQLLNIYVLKDTLGRLYIHSIAHKNTVAEVQTEQEKQCEDWPLLCKWRDIIEDKLSAFKNSMHKSGKPAKGGCSKSRPSADRIDTRPHHNHMRPWQGKPEDKDSRPEHPHGKGPHGKGPHGEHAHGRHHHSKVHRIMHMISRVIRVVVVPILVGVAAGVATYMAGLFIGMIVAFIWIKIRGSSPAYNRVALDEENADDDVPPYSPAQQEFYADEKSEVVVDTPPVYEEVAEKESAN